MSTMTMFLSTIYACLLLITTTITTTTTFAFVIQSPQRYSQQQHMTPTRTNNYKTIHYQSNLHSTSDSSTDIITTTTTTTSKIQKISPQFKILTCSSTACTKKRRLLSLDDYETFASLYTRKEESNTGMYKDVKMEESPCLGCCQFAPCVAVEHEDYVGTVGLEGMDGLEMNHRVFHGVITEDDVDRVWGCITNAIQTMAEEEEDDDDDGDNDNHGEMV